ncbi:MAG: DUF4214 domain-containing protein [Acidimicrobiales bacterium]|nr:DUF4214 domain-containing protein [Acidimicrobiales bacterium]HRW38943.1 DUF4214 domain-containing protein [Aquihabitans sp.]
MALVVIVTAAVPALAMGGPAQAAATPVMASASVSAADLAGWYRSKGKVSSATVDIDTLARYYVEEGADEGVAGDLAFAQSIVETGYFGFSTRVPASFNNFSGLGAVDGGSGAATFPDARTGVRAQIQHLRAYGDPGATAGALAHPLVDPRFHLVAPKGKAPTWEQFGNGIWATDPGYSAKVLSIHQQILAFAGATTPTTTAPPTPTTVPASTWAPFATSADLVGQGHRDLLARDATTAELVLGVDVLERQLFTPSRYLATLVEGEGAEHGAPIVRLYLAALGRLPDPSGMGYWTRRHLAGWTLAEIADQILVSSEFERRFGAPADGAFVDQLYENVLDRAGDPSGIDYWTRRLVAGQISRRGLVVQFSESSEHVRSAQIEVETSIVYLGMVRRAPDPSVISWWTTRRTGGAGLDVLVDLVYASSAYRARFS